MQRTQDFSAVTTKPKHPGRYMYKLSGTSKYVMRWWNGKKWQLNRRKALGFVPGTGDVWAGCPELHPEVEKMLSMGLASSDKQPVQLPDVVTNPKVSVVAVPVIA